MLTVFQIVALALFAPAAAAPDSASTPAQPAAAAAKPTDDGKKERLICKRQSTIGSLVAKTRVCLTKKDWEIAHQRGQEAARGAVDSCRMRADGGSC